MVECGGHRWLRGMVVVAGVDGGLHASGPTLVMLVVGIMITVLVVVRHIDVAENLVADVSGSLT